MIVARLKDAIENGRLKEAEKLIKEALDQEILPEVILEEGMIPAMRSAGEYYKNNEADIPRILAAARSMRCCLDILEPYLEKTERTPLGTVVLGTVKGDLHDMGKNLVAIMFRTAGFKVIDLGVDVSEKEFIRAVRQNPDVSVVCISSLLTTARPEMRHVVKAIRSSKDMADIKIMVGGGSVNRDFAEQIGADAYTETAVDAAEMAKTFFV